MYAIEARVPFAARMTSPKKSRSTKSKGKDALVLSVLERIATILLRLGFDAPKSEYLLRSAFILAARKLAESRGVRSTQSQIALVAGVNRLNVRRMVGSGLDPRFASELDHQSRIERILGGWRQDPRFADTRGRPKPLSIAGRTSEFAKLTSKYGRRRHCSHFARYVGAKQICNDQWQQDRSQRKEHLRDRDSRGRRIGTWLPKLTTRIIRFPQRTPNLSITVLERSCQRR